MKFFIVFAALMAFVAADLIAGPSVRTTITGPDGGQIVKDDYTGAVFNHDLVYPAAAPIVRYAPYPYVSNLYPFGYRYVF